MANGRKFYISTLIVTIIIILAYFLLPVYNQVNPSLFGIPFFLWYQIMWLFLAAVLYSLVSYLTR
jgi:hypothetical protein